MEQFVGLDISQATTQICVVDSKGKKMWQGKCLTTPEDIAKTIKAKSPSAALIGMESGALSPWLWHALKQMDFPIVCIDARHAHGALSVQINKTDVNDAHGIAQMMRTSFFKQVNVKSLDSHRIRSFIGARAQLVGIRTDLKNQIRGVLKTFGVLLSQSDAKGFAGKVQDTISDQPLLRQMVHPLMEVLESVQNQVRALDKLLQNYADGDRICSHLMTIPGVGPVTAVAFTAAVDNPNRFKNSRSVGAFFGLTNKRYQSGEIDHSGRISKCGDRLVRSYLFEAAGTLLTRIKTWSSLKSWGMRIAKRSGMSKAKVAVARKLAVIMHQMWLTGEAFRWSDSDTAAA
ncbi:IS110 family transposase [bacterium]|nr:IS110 family transposase [bacterium]